MSNAGWAVGNGQIEHENDLPDERLPPRSHGGSMTGR
jgi:hypothetical protein